MIKVMIGSGTIELNTSTELHKMKSFKTEFHRGDMFSIFNDGGPINLIFPYPLKDRLMKEAEDALNDYLKYNRGISTDKAREIINDVYGIISEDNEFMQLKRNLMQMHDLAIGSESLVQKIERDFYKEKGRK